MCYTIKDKQNEVTELKQEYNQMKRNYQALSLDERNSNFGLDARRIISEKFQRIRFLENQIKQMLKCT